MSEKLHFNRTKLELKEEKISKEKLWNINFNRTKLELKEEFGGVLQKI